MTKIKKRLITKLKSKLFGNPISGQKAYPVTVTFKTTYPPDRPEYNEWCQKFEFSSAVVKKCY